MSAVTSDFSLVGFVSRVGAFEACHEGWLCGAGCAGAVAEHFDVFGMNIDRCCRLFEVFGLVMLIDYRMARTLSIYIPIPTSLTHAIREEDRHMASLATTVASISWLSCP